MALYEALLDLVETAYGKPQSIVLQSRNLIASADLIETGPFAGLVRNGYAALLIDPAWSFTTRSPKGMGRSPDMHYSTMSIAEIKALPIKDLLAKNAVVFLWVIDTHLEYAFEIIKAWGLTYKTVGFYWAKTNKDGSDFTGMGYWTRANPEATLVLVDPDETSPICLLASHGKPKRESKSVRRLILSQRREHSRKPDEAHERIEALVPGPYLELFCREGRPGWSAWGNQINKFNDPI